MNSIIIIMLIIPCVCFSFSGKGSGKVEDPYQIINVQQLQEMNDELDAHYILMNDIDASETRQWNIGDHDNDPETPDSAMGFKPIGGGEKGIFRGVLYGNNKLISKLYINRPVEDMVGLFGYIVNGFTNFIGFRNLGMTECYISGGDLVGSFAGVLGGPVGIYNIRNCFSTGTITGDTNVGGFCGLSGDGEIFDCYSECDVNGEYAVGGFVGDGFSSRKTNCYSVGKVNGKIKTGGFCGDAHYSEIFENCYWDTETSGIEKYDSPYGEGKTTAEMMTQSTFLDWDFDSTWCMVEGKTYPHLQALEDCDNLVYVEDIQKTVDLSTYPNPFHQLLITNYELGMAGNVLLKIYDVMGNEVAVLLDDWQEAGRHEVNFDGSGLPAGMYFYVFRTGELVESGKMVKIE